MRTAGRSCVCIAPHGRRPLVYVLTQAILARVVTIRAAEPARAVRATAKGDHAVAIG